MFGTRYIKHLGHFYSAEFEGTQAGLNHSNRIFHIRYIISFSFIESV